MALDVVGADGALVHKYILYIEIEYASGSNAHELLSGQVTTPEVTVQQSEPLQAACMLLLGDKKKIKNIEYISRLIV